jgi:UDPglucose 6-dehydrogenase
MSIKISVFGLGKLGGTMAACFAERGFEVIGRDINDATVEKLNRGEAPAIEYGLSELVFRNCSRLRATKDEIVAVCQSDISFVVVPTPSQPDGKFSLEASEQCMKDLGLGLKHKNSYHVIVMTSTVLPGAMRNRLIPILEQASEKVCGVDFGVCYNPEFIALGSVINDFLNPDFYLLGEFDKRSGDLLESVHNGVSLNHAPVKRMTLENAELAKIALNSFVTLKVSFSNILADFCEAIPGGDVDIVSEALGMDKRIGRSYLTGGLGFAGPCFPRDNVALAAIGDELGLDTGLLKENQAFNSRIPPRLVAQMVEHIPVDAKVLVLGLAYKPRATLLDWSQGVLLCNELHCRGYNVSAHDPLAQESARLVLPSQIRVCDDLDKAVIDADVIAICTPDPIYRELSDLLNHQCANGKIIFDYWRVFSKQRLNSSSDYIFRGRGDFGDLSSKLSMVYE